MFNKGRPQASAAASRLVKSYFQFRDFKFLAYFLHSYKYPHGITYLTTSREAAADACGLPLFNSIPLSYLLNKRLFNSLLEEKKVTQHWYICFLHTTMRLFLVLFFCTNEMIHSYSEKILQNWHLYVSKHATFLLDCFEKDMCFGLEWLKDVLCEREFIKLLNRPHSCSVAPEAA